jgi:hypothetical protein
LRNWTVDGKVDGQVKRAKNLTYMTIDGVRPLCCRTFDWNEGCKQKYKGCSHASRTLGSRNTGLFDSKHACRREYRAGRAASRTTAPSLGHGTVDNDVAGLQVLEAVPVERPANDISILLEVSRQREVDARGRLQGRVGVGLARGLGDVQLALLELEVEDDTMAVLDVLVVGHNALLAFEVSVGLDDDDSSKAVNQRAW